MSPARAGAPAVGDPGTRPWRARPDGDRDQPMFAVPGMVLLAALAIYEGYDRLRIIPGGAHQPGAYLLGIAAAPTAYWLTRSVATGRVVALWRIVLVCAAAVLVCAGAGWDRALGVAWLLLAASILVLSVLSERGHRTTTPH